MPRRDWENETWGCDGGKNSKIKWRTLKFLSKSAVIWWKKTYRNNQQLITFKEVVVAEVSVSADFYDKKWRGGELSEISDIRVTSE